MSTPVLVIDNYDSFVYNLVQYLGELGAEPIVRRPNDLDQAEIVRLGPQALLVSPGPGRPEDADQTNAIIAQLAGQVPILGVCLGMQCIAHLYGADIVRAPQVMHGKTSTIHHSGTGIFAGLPQPFEATRYHSLVVDPTSFPEVLEVTARAEDDVLMGLRHRHLDIEGVQFHPESILSPNGLDLLRNFLNRAAASNGP